jgi:hypothetical protein
MNQRARWVAIAVAASASVAVMGWGWSVSAAGGGPAPVGAPPTEPWSRDAGPSAPGVAAVAPGELELRVSCPERAACRRVVVTPPGGTSRSARRDPESGDWTARFFVDGAVAAGPHDVLVAVTTADGRAERMQLAYRVDPRAPVLSVTLAQSRDDPAALQIAARGVVAASERLSLGLEATLSEVVRHVEVETPDDQLLTLRPAGEDGSAFRGRWTPRRGFSRTLDLRVVAVDRSLREHVMSVTFRRGEPVRRAALSSPGR